MGEDKKPEMDKDKKPEPKTEDHDIGQKSKILQLKAELEGIKAKMLEIQGLLQGLCNCVGKRE